MYRTFKCDLGCPSLQFVVGFLICSFIALFYKERWNLNIFHGQTYFLLIGCALVFFITEIFVLKLTKSANLNNNRLKFEPIENWKLFLFVVLQILYIFLVSRYIMSQAIRGSELSGALAEIDQDSKYEGKDLVYPLHINILRTISLYGGYIWCCLFPFYFQLGKKYIWQKILIFANLLLTITGSMFSGSRGSAFPYIFATLMFGYMVLILKKKGKLKIPFRFKVFVLLFVFVFANLFGQLGKMLGRETVSEELESTQYLFAVYCGAQIKNLDDYLTNDNIRKENLLGRNTFDKIYRSIYKLSGEKMPRAKNNIGAFNTVDNWFLGNVRSALAAYFADFGWFCFVVVAIFSYIISKLYYNVKKEEFFYTGKPDLTILLYAYLAFSPFLSFFGEKFFTRFYLPELIRLLMSGMLIIWFLFKFSVNQNNNRTI